MSVDERLRALLGGLAESTEVAGLAPDWDDLEARVGRVRQRRRRRLAAAAVAVFTLVPGPAAGFAAARIVDGGDDHSTVVADRADEAADEAAGSGSTPSGSEPAQLPEPDGPPPDNEEAARQAVIEAFTTVYTTSKDDERFVDVVNTHVQDPDDVVTASSGAGFGVSDLQVSFEIDEIRFLNPTTAAVRYSLERSGVTERFLPSTGGQASSSLRSVTSYPDVVGEAVLDDDRWKVTQATYCNDAELIGLFFCDFLYNDGGDAATVAPSDPLPPELREPDGPPPDNEEEARQAILEAYTKVITETNEDNAEEILETYVDDPQRVFEASVAAAEVVPEAFETKEVEVTSVEFLNPITAVVEYDVSFPGSSTPLLPDRVGRAVLVDGTWKMTRGTICNDLSMAGVECLG